MTPAETSELLGEVIVHLRAINATLSTLLERAPDPSAPIGEAIEWESADGLYRTTDRKMAENWAGAVGVTVVRRAPAPGVEGRTNG